MWIQRLSNSICGYPEHSLTYLNKYIKIHVYLGERDENNLLESKYPIKDYEDDDNENQDEEDDE